MTAEASAPRSRPRAAAAVSRLLDRPLTSVHLVLGVTALLTVLGLVMVLSASSVLSYRETHNSYAIFTRQAIWVVIGLPLMWTASRLPVWVFRRLAYPAMIGSIVLLAVVQVPGVGVSVNGNQNWIDFGGPFKLQPSEFAKLALVLWGADLLARKQKLIGQWRHLLVPLLPATALLAALIMFGHDLGTTMVLLAILLSLLWIAGTPLRLFGAAGLAIAAFFAYFVAGNQERLSRITGFLDPVADIQNGGFQAGHGFYALSSGGWWGVGLGASRQKWGTLPEAHTDFIFAVIGEELGLVGTLAVVMLFGLLAYAGLRIAMRATDPFVRLAAAGVTGWVAIQGIVNIGAVIGLLPITGIPLPLVSYGGSALLPTLFALGMLLAFARREPGAAAALAARRRRSLLHVFLPSRTSRIPAPEPEPVARSRPRSGATSR
jgi:cell division protein FtsW